MTDAPALPRRFYSETSVAEHESGFGVRLDARTLRTPRGAVFVAPTRALAEACAAEWAAQGEHIIPSTMPLTQFAFATVDATAQGREAVADYVAAFGETDLCAHRADSPVELAARQAQAWDPLIAWADEALGVRVPVVAGVIAARVGPEAQTTLREHALALDDFELTALAQATGLAGSALIGFALVRGAIAPQQAFEAAALDNLWSLERWGEDEEARARLTRQQGEFEALGRFLGALRA